MGGHLIGQTPTDKTEKKYKDYIDKYTMRQAIADGVTLEIVYEGRTHSAEIKNKEGLDNLNNLFFVNAPALLFPYIRAYISTLTNLSGFDPINLPTLNMSGLGEDLKKNTSNLE